MRVAFFSTLMNAPWGGSEVLWFKTALYMKSQNHIVSAFVKQWDGEPSQIAELKAAGVEVCYHTSFKKKSFVSKITGKIKESLFAEQSLAQPILNRRPDFIFFSQSHSYDLGYYSDGQLAPLLNTNVPFAIICQNNTDYNFVPEPDVRRKIRLVYQKAARVFFVSNRNRQTAENIICEKIKNAAIVSNSMSLTSETIGVLPFPPEEEVQFACVARLRCSHKGQNLLIDVLSQDKWKDRRWKLNLYGSGEDESYLTELTGYAGIADRVIFKGQVKDIQKIWRENHLFLLASFGEGMPLALQEAMLCGRAGVVTDVGGNAELVTEGATGWLATGTTLAAFDAALEKAWQIKAEWESIGRNAFSASKNKIDLFPEQTLAKFSEREITN